MSSASTQRLAALGTLCRRPTVLLLPLAPFVLITFVAMLLTEGFLLAWRELRKRPDLRHRLWRAVFTRIGNPERMRHSG